MSAPRANFPSLGHDLSLVRKLVKLGYTHDKSVQKLNPRTTNGPQPDSQVIFTTKVFSSLIHGREWPTTRRSHILSKTCSHNLSPTRKASAPRAVLTPPGHELSVVREWDWPRQDLKRADQELHTLSLVNEVSEPRVIFPSPGHGLTFVRIGAV